MRVGREAGAVSFLAKVLELLLAEPPLDKGAGIDSRRRMSLHVNEVTAVLFRWSPPEVAEADIIERGRRLETRDMAAELGRFLVGPKNDGNGVPTDDGADSVLQVAIPIRAFFAFRRDRIHVRGV